MAEMVSATPQSYSSLVASLTRRFHGGVDLRGEEGLDFLSAWCTMVAEKPDTFTANVNTCDFDSVRVSRIKTSAATGIRGSSFHSDEHSPFLGISYVRGGSLLFDQNRNTVRVRPGEMILIDYASTFHAKMLDQLNCVFTFVPHDLLSARNIGSRRLGGTVLAAAPLSAALGVVLENLLHPSERPAVSRRHIESAVLDLSLAILHEHAADSLAPEEIASGTLTRAIDFIDTHFSDPSLSVTHVAASINASPRYLHKLFETEGESVYGRIRRRRIEYAVSLLTDPASAYMPISKIAAVSGFTGGSQFSRTIREATGRTPRELRHEAS
ncbi:helix-turn-helix domain-containing protein [Rhodococcus sp. NPDC127528]|uniref:helix-turn-helix domain-containing protein n=1 Tax=unclassified Rhodococcus (in: high G+C Gram-positive bacteria) TaxID=192944 RepID=UPI003642D449